MSGTGWTRLDRLDAAAEPGTAIRAAFYWSCQHLPAPVAGAFRHCVFEH